MQDVRVWEGADELDILEEEYQSIQEQNLALAHEIRDVQTDKLELEDEIRRKEDIIEKGIKELDKQSGSGADVEARRQILRLMKENETLRVERSAREKTGTEQVKLIGQLKTDMHIALAVIRSRRHETFDPSTAESSIDDSLIAPSSTASLDERVSPEDADIITAKIRRTKTDFQASSFLSIKSTSCQTDPPAPVPVLEESTDTNGSIRDEVLEQQLAMTPQENGTIKDELRKAQMELDEIRNQYASAQCAATETQIIVASLREQYERMKISETKNRDMQLEMSDCMTKRESMYVELASKYEALKREHAIEETQHRELRENISQRE
ncbi:MAG: hypothetical protein QX203_19470, partial [Methylococcaceae bacterium]